MSHTDLRQVSVPSHHVSRNAGPSSMTITTAHVVGESGSHPAHLPSMTSAPEPSTLLCSQDWGQCLGSLLRLFGYETPRAKPGILCSPGSGGSMRKSLVSHHTVRRLP